MLKVLKQLGFRINRRGFCIENEFLLKKKKVYIEPSMSNAMAANPRTQSLFFYVQ